MLTNGMEYNVTCKNFSSVMNAPETIKFSGQVVQSASYDPPNTFRMKTEIQGFPFRVISYENVVEVNDHTVCFQTEKAKDDVRIVKGSNGNEYTVTTRNGRSTCSCPGFQFRKTCKHLK